MLQTNIPPNDPIVEVLRLAYRRGLVLRQQQAEKRKTADSDNLGRETLSAGLDSRSREKKSDRGQLYLIAPRS